MDASYTSRRGDCTTEFLTFASMQGEFRALNCELVGLSIDSTFSHIAWLRTIKEKVQFRHMKDVEVTFPVISDLTMDVSRLYGMLQPSASTTQAVRAVFFIDPESKVRALLYYPLSNGRISIRCVDWFLCFKKLG